MGVWVGRDEWGEGASPWRVARCLHDDPLTPTTPQLMMSSSAVQVVPTFVTDAQFLQGFAIVQAMPGPMFNFAAFLGGAYAGLPGALLAWVGLFLPGFLLIYAALPFWALATRSAAAQTFLRGVNAAASGLVVAAVVLLLDHVSLPPQRSIALVAFAVHHFAGEQLVGSKLNPPMTILLGAMLGVPLCLPWAWSEQASVAAASPPS